VYGCVFVMCVCMGVCVDVYTYMFVPPELVACRGEVLL